MIEPEILLNILDRARWAPSGDNCQPWEFEIFSEEDRVRIHLERESDNVYEFCSGRPAWIAAGALIENMSIAASVYGIVCRVVGISEFVMCRGFIDVKLTYDDTCDKSNLEKFIEIRSVERFALSIRNFDKHIENDLAQALGPDFSVQWFGGVRGKISVILCHLLASRIRLSIPEAYVVHKKIIDWDHKYSMAGIPSAAMGMGRPGQALTKWAMASWARVHILMTYFLGSLFPRFEIDFIPGVFCARHFQITCTRDPDWESPEEAIEFGRALQRFWLCATKHGLALQPAFATIIFARYAADKIVFTKEASEQKRAMKLLERVEKLSGKGIRQIKFLGRLGFSNKIGKPSSRSIRKPIEDLIRPSS